MKAGGRVLCSTFLFCSVFIAAQPDVASHQATELIADLLKFPAPAPPAGVPGAELPQNNIYRAPTFSVPPEDAPLDVLGRYWAQHNGYDAEKPDSLVSQRLLDASQKYPELLPSLLKLLPKTEEAYRTIKQIYDNNSAAFSPDWRKEVQRYLELNSQFFRNELVAEASSAKDEKDAGYVEHSEELTALVRLDWPRAQPVLKKLEAGQSARASCLAKILTYRHDQATPDGPSAKTERNQLQAIVASHTALGYCRSYAADALLETEWQGRDEWYISLFHDPTLLRLMDKSSMYHPLSGPVSTNPEHWIPVMTTLVTNPDRAVHDNAVAALVQFQLRSARKDALEPLLPWLADPKWSSADDRLRLIQSVDDLDMTESIPGLIAAVTQTGSEYDQSYAAQSLAHFKDPRANPALRIALAQQHTADHQRRFVAALIACGGVSSSEAAQAIEQYAEFTKDAKGEDVFESYSYSYGKGQIPVEVSLGAQLARSGPSDEAVAILIQRAAQLQPGHPDTAQRLRLLLSAWSSQSADRETIREIRERSITAQAFRNALGRRDSLKKTVADELTLLSSSGGAPGGFATVLLANSERESAILRSSNPEAQAAVLASARLIREKLPLDDVAALLGSPNAEVSSAGEAYLETEDSSRARTLVLARHPGEAMIIGARQSYDPGHSSYVSFDRLEAQLRTEVSQSKEPDEIYALLSAGYWGDAGQIVVHVRRENSDIQYIKTGANTKTRPLTPGELGQMTQFIRENQIDNLGPLNLAADDGIQYEYIHLTRDGGRRVFMNNPGLGGSGGSAYDRLVKVFHDEVNKTH